MKLVKILPCNEGKCEANHNNPEPSIVQIGVKGIDFQLCARHAAQMIKELIVPLGDWADRAVLYEVAVSRGCNRSSQD